MYLDFFKFRKNPFHITPDPDFLFLSPSHNEAFSSISRGIELRKGLVVVTGEVGVGKTTILRSYLEGTDPARIRIAYIFNAALSFGKLMKQIVSELGIPAVGKDVPDLVDSLFLYLIEEYKNDRRVVLIIDEAQNLPVETLERFRMLSNRETSQEKLLQVILVGQLEFEDRLNLPELRELKQRIASSCRIDTLQPDESLAYIQHRLMKASSFHNPVFTKDALKLIVKEARGIPRTINVICDNALITAFGYQRKPVDVKIVKEVIKDLRGAQPRISFRWEFVLFPVLVGFSGLVVLASMGLLSPKEIPPVRTEIFSAKIPSPPPAAETVKEPGSDTSVEEASRGEPGPSIPEIAATGSEKSASEIVPPAPAERQCSVNTQASPSAETVKEPGSDASVEEASGGEPGPSIPEVATTASEKSASETVPPASVERQSPGDTQAPAAEKAPPSGDDGTPAQGGPAVGPKLQSHRYIVRFGPFVDKETAEGIKARLRENGYRAVVKTVRHPAAGKVFVIQLQPVDSASRATKLMTQLRGELEEEPEIIKVPSR
jgi:general secretion pathway protein A